MLPWMQWPAQLILGKMTSRSLFIVTSTGQSASEIWIFMKFLSLVIPLGRMVLGCREGSIFFLPGWDLFYWQLEGSVVFGWSVETPLVSKWKKKAGLRCLKCIWVYKCGLWRKGTGEQTQRTNVLTPPGERQGGMNWEIGIDVYTLQCARQMTNESLL